MNDDYGHMAGDELLRRFSAELKSGSRTKDIVGRWGGDEFIVLLDGCDGGSQEAYRPPERMDLRELLGSWD